MEHFFDIDIRYLNLFSIMLGMSFVVLSSMWKGRLKYTRVVYFYMAYLILYYGFLKPNQLT